MQANGQLQNVKLPSVSSAIVELTLNTCEEYAKYSKSGIISYKLKKNID